MFEFIGPFNSKLWMPVAGVVAFFTGMRGTNVWRRIEASNSFFFDTFGYLSQS
jgi:hypothetical protein